MGEHAVADAQARDEAAQAYIRQTVGTSGGTSTAEELQKLAGLRDSGVHQRRRVRGPEGQAPRQLSTPPPGDGDGTEGARPSVPFCVLTWYQVASGLRSVIVTEHRSPVGRLMGAVVPQVVGAVDPDELIERLDVDALMARVDVDALLTRIDIDALLGRIDIDALLERIDVDGLLGRIDVSALIARIDMNEVIGQVDMNGVAGSTSTPCSTTSTSRPSSPRPASTRSSPRPAPASSPAPSTWPAASWSASTSSSWAPSTGSCAASRQELPPTAEAQRHGPARRPGQPPGRLRRRPLPRLGAVQRRRRTSARSLFELFTGDRFQPTDGAGIAWAIGYFAWFGLYLWGSIEIAGRTPGQGAGRPAGGRARRPAARALAAPSWRTFVLPVQLHPRPRVHPRRDPQGPPGLPRAGGRLQGDRRLGRPRRRRPLRARGLGRPPARRPAGRPRRPPVPASVAEAAGAAPADEVDRGPARGRAPATPSPPIADPVDEPSPSWSRAGRPRSMRPPTPVSRGDAARRRPRRRAGDPDELVPEPIAAAERRARRRLLGRRADRGGLASGGDDGGAHGDEVGDELVVGRARCRCRRRCGGPARPPTPVSSMISATTRSRRTAGGASGRGLDLVEDRGEVLGGGGVGLDPPGGEAAAELGDDAQVRPAGGVVEQGGVGHDEAARRASASVGRRRRPRRAAGRARRRPGRRAGPAARSSRPWREPKW